MSPNTPLANNDSFQSALHAQLLAQSDPTQSEPWLSFAQFMQIALYEPGLGYYAGAATKLGSGGDFVTAPLISPAFAFGLTQQFSAWMQYCPPVITEFGAGDGTLAAQLLNHLAPQLATTNAPQELSYQILEVSADLRARQAATLARLAPHHAHRVTWLNELPSSLDGIVFGNELLDAMPVELFRLSEDGIEQGGVSLPANLQYHMNFRPASKQLAQSVQRTLKAVQTQHTDWAWPSGFVSEIGLQGQAWTASIAQRISQGILLLIDYGFTQSEYYLPERKTGTLMGHYQHRADPNVLTRPGEQDITAHVDFSAIAKVALEQKMELMGYTSQARFLINCGVLEWAKNNHTAPAMSGLQKLLSEAEMGELFKVIAFSRAMPETADCLMGFTIGDRSHKLGLDPS